MPADGDRAAILARIRKAAATGDEEARCHAVAARLVTHKPNLIPKRAEGDLAHRLAVFSAQMDAVGGSVETVSDLHAVPEAVAAYLRQLNLPARIRHGEDAALASLPWHRAGTLEVAHGRADPGDTASLSHAYAGVAETGTLILISGSDNPTSLNFLPEAHIVVVDAEDLLGNYEEAWARLREKFGPGNMPRTVNMISGPSRTGDVEQTIVRPAHGPKNMHVIVVGA
jgi:L-lactate dehydrogenase complex protein LldG